MTLLFSVVGRGFSLAASDTRITVRQGNTYRVEDEKFNKHIVFNVGDIVADVMYTGLAKWSEAGKSVRMDEIIAESLTGAAKLNLTFGPLALKLCKDLAERMSRPGVLPKGETPLLELHIIARHSKLPHPFMVVISTFRDASPWRRTTDLQWEYSFAPFRLYFCFADAPDLVVGGMDTTVRQEQRTRILAAVDSGANAFDTSKLCSQAIEMAAKRHKTINARSVSVVLPDVGMLDTDLFERGQQGIVAFLPRLIFGNGTNWAPSEVPVDLQLITDGQHPPHGIFFKAIVDRYYKRADRRRIFRHRKGKLLPSVLGLLMLGLFGVIPDEYTDFGLTEVPPRS